MYYTEFLPRPFLKNCSQELLDLVVLAPQWLMIVMKAIIELSIRNDVVDLTINQLEKLVVDGIADFEVFEACWKRFVPATKSPSGINIEVHHLCQIFQAHCLIYPLQSIAVHESDQQVHQSSKYIIPCKLPDSIHDRKVFRMIKHFSTLYVDFRQFLPDEIYHRLIICLISAKNEVGQDCILHNHYSKRSCFFFDVQDTNWFIELEPENQRLKIMFL